MISCHSPAKVNLFLRIEGKRADGYHEIATLMQTVAIKDTLTIRFSDCDKIACNHPQVPLDCSNLVLKAAELFRKKSGKKFFVSVDIKKSVPPQSGLGGGSGNAATTLWALNKMCGQPACDEELASWASEIGSDIPFFFSTGTAFCRGRGEQVESVAPLSAPGPLSIVFPEIGMSTPAVYAALRCDLLRPRDPLEALRLWQSGNAQHFNDLEEAAFYLSKPLKRIRDELVASGYDAITLSGSGSALLCWGMGRPLANIRMEEGVCFTQRKRGEWY